MRTQLLFLSVCLLLGGFAYAESAPTHEWGVGWIDASVQPGEWQRMPDTGLNYGFSKDTIFVRTTLHQPAGSELKQRIYDLGSANLRYVLFQHYVDGQLVDTHEAGTTLPFSERAIKDRNLAFPVDLVPGENQILIAIQSRNGIAVAPSLVSPMSWHQNVSNNSALLGLFTGMTLILALYNLFVFVVSRDRVFLSLSLTLSAALMWHLVGAGAASMYLYPEHPQVHGLVARVAVAAYCAGMCLLTNDYLRCSSWSPLLSKVLIGQAAAIVFVFVFPVFGVLPMLAQVVVFSAPLVCVVAVAQALRHRIEQSPSYVVTFGLFAVGLLAYVVQIVGLLPLHWAVNLLTELAVIGLGVVTSFGLASRLSEEKLARQIAVREADAKDQFLANMTHEIRTPLNAVIGFGELLKDMPLSADAKDLSGKISIAGKNLLGIINDILDFSKVNAGKVELDPHPVAVRDMMNELHTLFLPVAQEKQIELEITCAESVPSFLVFDQLRVTQVLTNLLSNALKFTQEGKVSLRASGALNTDRFDMQVVVADTGIGMTLPQVERLFQPFTQADASTTRQFGGSGLGLTISKQFVELMGGEVHVSSQPDQGTTFHVTLPGLALHQEETGSTDGLPQQDGVDHLAGARILVAEDNEMNQLLVKRMLQKAGADCVVVENGSQALALLGSQEFAAVLMDCQMPLMDGYETTRRLRQLPVHAQLPVVALTANATEQDRQRCLLIGMNDYLTKPIRYDALVACLERQLAQRQIAA